MFQNKWDFWKPLFFQKWNTWKCMHKVSVQLMCRSLSITLQIPGTSAALTSHILEWLSQCSGGYMTVLLQVPEYSDPISRKLLENKFNIFQRNVFKERQVTKTSPMHKWGKMVDSFFFFLSSALLFKDIYFINCMLQGSICKCIFLQKKKLKFGIRAVN